MTTFYLVLTFFAMAGYGVAMPTAVIPSPYPSVQACDDAGRAAKEHFNGGAKIEWTCVQARSN